MISLEKLMSVLMAHVAPVHIGLLVIEGVRDECGRYHVAVPQICELFRLNKAVGTRDIKALLGGNSSVIKLRVWGSQNRNYINAVNLNDFRRLMFRLSIKGNLEAVELSEALVDMALDELFNDAFGLSNTAESRQRFLLEWQSVRQRLRDVHGGMQQAALRRHHPASRVHDYLTVLIFGDTAEAARMKQLVDPEADVTIGLNHQEEIAGMNKLIQAKKNYAYMRDIGTWEQQVERAVAKR